MDQYIIEYIYYNQLDGEVKAIGKYLYDDNNNNFTEGINIFIDEITEDKVKELMKEFIITVSWRNLINREHK